MRATLRESDSVRVALTYLTEAVAGPGTTPSTPSAPQNEPTGWRIAALSRFHTLMPAMDSSSDESSFSS